MLFLRLIVVEFCYHTSILLLDIYFCFICWLLLWAIYCLILQLYNMFWYKVTMDWLIFSIYGIMMNMRSGSARSFLFKINMCRYWFLIITLKVLLLLLIQLLLLYYVDLFDCFWILITLSKYHFIFLTKALSRSRNGWYFII